MFIGKIIAGCWDEQVLTLGDMPEDFVLSARKLCVMEIDEREQLETLYAKLAEVIQEYHRLMDENILVRNVKDDSKPDWAIKQIPLVQAIAKAQAILADYHKLKGE
jgi:hypothetical protein